MKKFVLVSLAILIVSRNAFPMDESEGTGKKRYRDPVITEQKRDKKKQRGQHSLIEREEEDQPWRIGSTSELEDQLWRTGSASELEAPEKNDEFKLEFQ